MTPHVVMAALSFRWGGAAEAARRLEGGLVRAGCRVTRYAWAREPDEGEDEAVFLRSRLNGAALDACRERGRLIDAQFAPHGGRAGLRYRFSSDCTAAGAAFTRHLPAASVLNLHWVSEFLDVPLVWTSLPPGLPVVWTLHDLNPLTGGCHYPGSCRRFTAGCGACPFLGNDDPADLSAAAFARKAAALAAGRGPLHFVAPSRWMAAAVRASGITRDFPVTVIPNAIDPDQFHPLDSIEARRSLDLPMDRSIVLFVASDLAAPRKGLDIFADALTRLDERDRPMVLLVGGGNPPAALCALPHRLFGHVDDPHRLCRIYAAADMVAVPTREDNLPNVVLEAFACARPVVATDVGGVPDLVQDGETGLLVAADDPAALAAGLRQLLSNPSACTAMGRQAYGKVQAEHLPTVQAARYLDLFQMLANR